MILRTACRANEKEQSAPGFDGKGGGRTPVASQVRRSSANVCAETARQPLTGFTFTVEHNEPNCSQPVRAGDAVTQNAPNT